MRGAGSRVGPVWTWLAAERERHLRFTWLLDNDGVKMLERLVRDRDQLDDPVATIRRAEALERQVAAQVAELRAESATAVRRLRRLGWTFQEIALATGLTPREVGDLARESRRSASA